MPGNAFEYRQVVQQRIGTDARVYAKVLWQIAQHLAQFFRFAHHVNIAKADAALARGLQAGNAAHQGGFAGAIGAQQAKHAGRNMQVHAVERLGAVGIAVRKLTQFKHGKNPFSSKSVPDHCPACNGR